MSIQNTFSTQQIQFLADNLFDVLAKDFDYNLKASKRKAALAKALGARNFDALMQRASKTQAASQVQAPLEEYYRWLKPEVIDGEQRYIQAGDPRFDEHSLSDIHFESIEQAYDEELLEDWGFDREAIEGLVLVKATLTEAEPKSLTPLSAKTVAVKDILDSPGMRLDAEYHLRDDKEK